MSEQDLIQQTPMPRTRQSLTQDLRALGVKEGMTMQDIGLDSDQFPEIGAAFEEMGLMKTGLVGSAWCRLLPQRPAVDFAIEWLRRKRMESG
jgi:aminoglycoside 3-N-acetyltransferase